MSEPRYDNLEHRGWQRPAAERMLDRTFWLAAIVVVAAAGLLYAYFGETAGGLVIALGAAGVLTALFVPEIRKHLVWGAVGAAVFGGVIVTGREIHAHLLTALLVLPLLGAFVMLFTPRQWPNTIRRLSVGVMFVELALSLSLLYGDYGTGAFQFVEQTPWIETFGISYKVGVDGISLWLVILTTLLTPIALFVSWTGIDTKLKEYAIGFLLLETGMLGAFVALDLFLFYVAWELMLVPMYLIIGVWGGPRRVYAAVKFFLYTMVGSLLMLVAILYVVGTYRELAGQYSFDIEELRRVVFPYGTQVWLFLAFVLAFAVKVPMFPLHTWLPDAHTEAPTGGSVILAAVLLKLGTYGFLRFAMPLFPLASHFRDPSLPGIAPLVLVPLSVVAIIYGAYCAWVQRDVKKLVAYSSVSHMGFVMLGVFALTNHGVEGAVLQMLNHGVSTGALFILVGVIYERRHTRDLDQFGGLAKAMPWYATLFVIVAMSSIGLPGTNGFVGEFMILAGSFSSQALQPWSEIVTVLAALGVIFAAIYMLHAVLKMFWGPLDKKENQGLPDVTGREAAALLPLVALIFWIGVHPSTFLDDMKPSVQQFITDFQGKKQESRRDDSLRLLDRGHFEQVRVRTDAREGDKTRADDRLAMAERGGER